MDILREANDAANRQWMKHHKKEQMKARIHSKVQAAGDWINRNAGTILALTPVAIATIGAVTNLVRTIGYRMDKAEEAERRDYSCYDRSEGHYWDLNRELTNLDWAVINKRKAEGEKLGDILEDLDVLE